MQYEPHFHNIDPFKMDPQTPGKGDKRKRNTVRFTAVSFGSDGDEKDRPNNSDAARPGNLSRGESLKRLSQSASRISKSIVEKRDYVLQMYSSLFGDNYSKKEGTMILVAGALLSFNIGYVNGSCLSGLISPNGTARSIAGFSSAYTKSALYLGAGEYDKMALPFAMIGSYFLGGMVSGVMTPNPKPHRIEPTYGPTFLLGGGFLLASSFLAWYEIYDDLIFCFAAAAAGIQNGIATLFSNGLVRCSLSGSTVDIGIVTGQVMRGSMRGVPKALALLLVVVNFWLGGIVSFYGTRHFRTMSIFFNTGLFFFIGLMLIVFLIRELNISTKDAIFGTWNWRNSKIMNKLKVSTVQYYESSDLESFDIFGDEDEKDDKKLIDFEELFDEIDSEDKGLLDESEVFVGLRQAGFSIDMKSVVRLMSLTAQNRDDIGVNKAEWLQIAQLCSEMLK